MEFIAELSNFKQQNILCVSVHSVLHWYHRDKVVLPVPFLEFLPLFTLLTLFGTVK